MNGIKTPEEIGKIIELREAEAWADIINHAPGNYNAKVEKIGSAVVLLTKTIDIILFNRVIGLGLFEPCEKDTIKQIIELYQSNNIKNFAIQLSPFATPENIPEWLREFNLCPSLDWVKVYRETGPVTEIPTDLRIEQIGKERAEDFARIAAAAFNMPDSMRPWMASNVGMPGWHNYLAYDHDLPVAAAALCIKNEVGWLGIGSTLPSHRGRGAQGALMTHRIKEAGKLGCKLVCTETGKLPDTPNPSLNNMFRTGFKQAYLRKNYMFKL